MIYELQHPRGIYYNEYYQHFYSMDNYRGIIMTSVFGKLFESLLLIRLTELNHDQSYLQYGFTKGLTPTMATLLLTEAATDSRMRKLPLYLTTLDTQKTFDVVDQLYFSTNYMSQVMRKRVLCHMRTTKVQISLHICAVWSAPLLFAA